MALLVILAGGMVLFAVVALFKARDDRERRIREVGREIEAETRRVNAIEKAVRLQILKGLLLGQKCKGCAQIVPRDELDEAGEDSRGRPIMLCKKCRDLVGLE